MQRISNLFFWVIFGFVLYRQSPVILNNFKSEGVMVEKMQVQNMQTNETLEIFKPNENYIVLFWATWCAPCKLEMKRLKASVEKGKIPREKLLLINTGEPVATIKQFLEKNPYPFTFVDERKKLVELFQVQSTPTMVLVEKQKAASVSSGISFIGILKAESLF